MPGAFAFSTLVFEMWAISAPVEVSTAEAWRWRITLQLWLALLKWWMLVALPTFLQWLLYAVQLDVSVGENSTVSLCDEEVHAVCNNGVETHLITVLVKLL